PTVSSIVRERIEQKLVTESELGESKGGRKPTMLLVNKNGFYVIGVDAGPKTIECILSNLSGQIKDRIVVSIEFPLTNDSFLDLLKIVYQKLLNNVEERTKIFGYNIAMHGYDDVETVTT